MQPVLKRGRTTWDRDLLSEDEHVERVRLARGRLEATGFDALVVVGRTTDYAPLTYLTGNVPPLGWMAAIVTATDDPVLITGGGSRDLPFLSTQTWIRDIRTSPSLFAGPAEGIRAVVDERCAPGAAIAVAGLDMALAPAAASATRQALTGWSVSDADELVDDLRRTKRPREIVALRRARDLADAGVQAALEARAAGEGDHRALLAAERRARALGARDARVLGAGSRPNLAPVEGAWSGRAPHLALWCAAEHSGYWGAATGEDGAGPSSMASAGLQAMVTRARPGTPASDLAAAAAVALPGGRDDVAHAYGLGGGIGLAADEAPRVSLTSTDVLADGDVLALRCVTQQDGTLRCASGTWVLGPDGPRAL